MRAYREDEWKRIRERGEAAFLLRHGLLGRGLPLGVIVAVAVELSLGGTFPEALREPGFWGRLLFAVAVFTVSGSVASHYNWKVHERRYGEGADGSGARPS
ncbi:MAG: hypothetical protein R3263_02375 [Myxococcota bacterium]|nr:hypothetical protein [Myxococcota bacterium]